MRFGRKEEMREIPRPPALPPGRGQVFRPRPEPRSPPPPRAQTRLHPLSPLRANPLPTKGHALHARQDDLAPGPTGLQESLSCRSFGPVKAPVDDRFQLPCFRPAA